MAWIDSSSRPLGVVLLDRDRIDQGEGPVAHGLIALGRADLVVGVVVDGPGGGADRSAPSTLCGRAEGLDDAAEAVVLEVAHQVQAVGRQRPAGWAA